MSKLIYSTILIASLALSCKEDTVQEVLPQNVGLQEQVDALPGISAVKVEQAAVKGVDVRLNFNGEAIPDRVQFSLLYDYFEDGKLKAVTNNAEPMVSYEYEADEVKRTSVDSPMSKLYKLNNEGLAETDDQSSKFYYKNGFLIFALGEYLDTFTYSSKGNLTSWRSGLEKSATFTYTGFENNIRQEVLNPSTLHSTFRDSYLGNFSSNLISDVVFKEGENGSNVTTLTFDYTFDNQGRVAKVLVERDSDDGLSSGFFEYSLSY